MMTKQEARLTPAHAGKTHPGIRRSQCPQAHPRTRGENYTNYPYQVAKIGSPPHTRGKLCFQNCVTILLRLTPAHAGKTSFSFSSCFL